LRVVVATMGLAAGINFSLRSVALAGDSYRRDYIEQPLRPDEILQMFGRAGRRGIDEVGYALVSANQIRLHEGHPLHLSRSGLVDWSALLGLMTAAAQQGRDPFTEAVRVQQRLFTTKPIFLGVEESLKHPETPCGLKTDAERARHVRKRVKEMLNSRGEWELMPAAVEKPVGEIFTIGADTSDKGGTGLRPVISAVPREMAGDSQSPDQHSIDSEQPTADSGAIRRDAELNGPEARATISPRLVPILSIPAALEKIGQGNLAVLSEIDGVKTYG